MRSSGQFQTFYFFLTKRLHSQQRHKTLASQQKLKNALKKHLRGKKSLIRLFTFCAFVLLLGCVFVLFVPLMCVESFCGKKWKGLKLSWWPHLQYYWVYLITNMNFFYHNLFQLTQYFSIITSFLSQSFLISLQSSLL